jgi:cyclopropane-fatty-acyl-phospholipid synthase
MSFQEMSPSIDKWLLRRIYESVGCPPIRLKLGNGVEVSSTDPAPLATVVIENRRILQRLMLDPEAGFGDAYSEGRITVEGDLIAALEALYQSIQKVGRHNWYSRIMSRCMDYWQRNTLGGSRRNIHQHYDLTTDFYRLWLDPELVYTCAYFPSVSATLEEAQTAKMDYICRKLKLQPGERVVDAGCGWGALALHMAKHYGVTVRAFNISHEQILWARERAKELKLSDWVEFIEDDYRNISGKFDVFVSVGMLEHVGRARYAGLGDLIHRVAGDSGRGLFHFIGRNRPAPFSRWIRKRIFPGAYTPALREAMEIFERWNFSVLDVENLRLHYVKTLEHWLDRFEKANRQISAIYDARLVRAWRLYLAGSLVAFETGTLQLFQMVFAGSSCRPPLWTRAPLYTGEPEMERKPQWTHAMS